METAKRVKHCVIVLAALLPCPLVWAQSPPDAGVLRQQIEQKALPLPPAATPPSAPSEPAPKDEAGGATVIVKEFRFVGNTRMASDDLDKVVAPWVGRSVSLNDLRAAAQAVAEAYRDAGWVVRAFLPRQDVTEGIVTIEIVESVFGRTRLDGPASSRVDPDTIMAGFAAGQRSGAPLNTHQLDRALLLADDLPGVAVTGFLAVGANEGETDLVIKESDEPLLIGEVAADNIGSRSTGAQRLALTAMLNSPLHLGDQAQFNAIHTEGSDYGRLGYSLPVGHNGMRAGLSASSMHYKLVSPEFTQLQARGNSDTLGANLSYPIVRSRLKNLYVSLAYDRKHFRNEANNAVQSDYHIYDFTLTLSGNLFDHLGGGGANSMTLAYVDGRVAHGTLDAAENPALAGRFGKWLYAASRQQAVSDRVSLYAAVNGQHSSKKLDTSERFYLGGANGVRAYPATEAGGSRGQLVNLELRWQLPHGFNLTGFYDWGRVGNFGSDPSYALKGHGISLGWLTVGGLQLKATWARRDGSNPNPTATGKDQDGSLRPNRFWLTASLPF